MSAPRTHPVGLAGLAVLGAAAVAAVAAGPARVLVRMLSVPLHERTWRVWVGTVNGVALLAVLALPVAALAVWALARRRGAAGDASARRTALAEVGIVYGTAPWVWLTMQPGSAPAGCPAA